MLLGDPTRLSARAARPDLPATRNERRHDLAQRKHPLVMNVVGVPLRRHPHALDREQDEGLLIGGCSDVGDDERQRRSFRILPAVCCLGDEPRHCSSPPTYLRRMKYRVRPSPSSTTATSGLPVSLDQDASPVRAVGSSDTTSMTSPELSWRTRAAISGVSVAQSSPTRSIRTSGGGGPDTFVISVLPLYSCSLLASLGSDDPRPQWAAPYFLTAACLRRLVI